MIRKFIGAAALLILTTSCEMPPPSAVSAPVCRAPLVQATMIELYFGRSMPNGGFVSDAQWNDFLKTSITPRFPEGLTVVDAYGQSGNRSGRPAPERAKLVLLGVRDAAAASANVEAVIADYKQRFNQLGVFRVERPICASL